MLRVYDLGFMQVWGLGITAGWFRVLGFRV